MDHKTLLRRRYPFFLELYGINLPIDPLHLYDRHTLSLGLYIILHRQHAIPHLQTRAFRWAAGGCFDNDARLRYRRHHRHPDASAPGSFRQDAIGNRNKSDSIGYNPPETCCVFRSCIQRYPLRSQSECPPFRTRPQTPVLCFCQVIGDPSVIPL